jgi:hypothetical protein
MTTNINFLERVGSDEIEKMPVCEHCEDTGLMNNTYFDSAVKEYIYDGQQKCWCQYGEIITD